MESRPSLPAAALAGWAGATAWGLAEVLGAVVDGRLAQGAPGVAALCVGAALFPGAIGGVGGVAAALVARDGSPPRSLRTGLALGLTTSALTAVAAPIGAFGPGSLAVVGAVAVGLAAHALRSRGALLALAAAVAVVATGLPRWDAPPRRPSGGWIGVRPPPAAPAATRRNVLLVTIDAARADRYENERVATPAFDEVASEGVRFDTAMTPIPRSAPALAALHTGAPPWEGGIWSDGQELSPALPTLAERLGAEGWRTAAFVSTPMARRHSGLARGFSVFDDDFAWVKGQRDTALGRLVALGASPPVERRAGDTVERALRWLQGPAEAPWLAWVHLGDPVAPYDPPPPWDERYTEGAPPADLAELPGGLGPADVERARARYDGEVAYADAQVLRLLRWLDHSGEGERTVVVYVGTHGESLGEGGVWFAHGERLHEAALHVPLAVRAPGSVAPGAVVAEPVETPDVVASVLAWALGRPAPDVARPAARSALRDEAGVVWASARGRTDRWLEPGGRYLRVSSNGVETEAAPTPEARERLSRQLPVAGD